MTFLNTVFENLAAAAERPAVVNVVGAELREVSGSALLARINHARGYLRSIGVAPGDRVGLLGTNHADWIALDLAILAHGAVTVPLFDRQDPAELASMLKDCGARAVLASTQALASALVSQIDTSTRVALYADALDYSWPNREAPVSRPPSDPFTIIYTSGTSGEPKGVVLSQANIDFMVPQTSQALAATLGATRADERVYHFLPLCFAGSRLMMWTQLYRGTPLRLGTDLTRIADEMAAADPHYFLNVPAVLDRIRRATEDGVQKKGGLVYDLYRSAMDAALAERPDETTTGGRIALAVAKRTLFPLLRKKIGPSLRFLICGSAALSPTTQTWFEIIGIRVLQVYGLTETTGIVTMDSTELATPGTVGIPIQGVDVRISDEGELLCRGDNVFTGYWGRPEATEAAMDDGWFRTGDLASIDDKGRVSIVGRLKNLVIPASGKNIAPEPIEEQLMALCPSIEHAIVIGHGRPFLTVMVTGATPDVAERAVEELNAQLSRHTQLRKTLCLEESFNDTPGLLTANQKLRRNAVEAHYAVEIEDLYRRVNP